MHLHALACMRHPDEAQQGQLAAGNRLWEWYSVGRYGTAGFNIKTQQFEGEQWPEVALPLTLRTDTTRYGTPAEPGTYMLWAVK